MILSALFLGLGPLLLFQEPEETKLEAAQRKVAELEAELGPQHPEVAKYLNRLANLLRTKGSYAEARPLLERSLAILEQFRGPEHPDVAMTLNHLAESLHEQGSYVEARPLYERGLETTLLHLSKNLGAMTETERFQYLDIQEGPELLLLNLVAMQRTS